MKHGDAIRITKADGAEVAGEATWGRYLVDECDCPAEKGTVEKVRYLTGFLASCGVMYTAAELAAELYYCHPVDYRLEFEGHVYQEGLLDYQCIAEQLLATGELRP